MTDDPRPLSGDELVAAVLDGEATPAERQQVDSDPELSARLAEFRSAAAAVAEAPAPLTDEARAQIVTAASAALDERPSRADTGEHVMAPFESRRRAARGRRLPPVGLVAAVVLALLVAAVSLFIVGNDSTTENQASDAVGAGASDEAVAAEGADQGGGDGGDRADEADQAEPAPSLPAEEVAFLGRFPDADALREALKGVDPRTLRPAAGGPSPDEDGPSVADVQIERCDDLVRSTDTRLGDPTGAATAYVGDDAVILRSYPLTDTPGQVREYAFSLETCEVVLAIQP